MNTDLWIDRLYNDESLTDNLEDEDAERLLSWAESQLIECDSDGSAQQLIESIRLLDHYVGEGESFDELFGALKANSFSCRPDAPLASPTDDADPMMSDMYPVDDEE
jgi:hypothetical protein